MLYYIGDDDEQHHKNKVQQQPRRQQHQNLNQNLNQNINQNHENIASAPLRAMRQYQRRPAPQMSIYEFIEKNYSYIVLILLMIIIIFLICIYYKIDRNYRRMEYRFMMGSSRPGGGFPELYT